MRKQRFTSFPRETLRGRDGAPLLTRVTQVLALSALCVFAFSARAASEAPPKGFQFVDLAPFAPSFAEFTGGKPLNALPKGVQSYDKVPFRIGPPVAVTGLESARGGELFPKELTGIKIDAKARRIHLLNATLFPDRDGVPLAKIIFRYADGTGQSVRFGYGVHTRAWTIPRTERRDELADPNSRLAWSETNERSGTGLRLFHSVIDNPRPSETIASIDIISFFSRAAPLIFAMTAETPDSELAPSEAVPALKAVRELNEFPDNTYRQEMTALVTDGESGQPVANALATLSVADDKQSFVFGETRTDTKGFCRFTYPPQHMVGFTMWIHAPERMPVLISESMTNTARFKGEYTAVLKRGTTIGGVVKDAAGKPVSNAEVVIHRILRSGNRHYARTDYDNVRTAPDGKWKSSNLPPDLTGLTFQIFHPDYRSAFYATEGFAPPPSSTPSSSSSSGTTSSTTTSYRRLADGTLVPVTTNRRTTTARPAGVQLVKTNALADGDAEFTVQPAAILKGTLADSGGRPIPAADMIVQRPTLDRTYVQTDAQGRFEARVGDPGDVALIVLRDGFSPLWTNVIASTNSPTFALKLSPPRVVNGLVRERNQRPVAAARVRLDEWNGTTDLLRWQTVTDEQGRFSFTGAPNDRVMFYVTKTNYSTMRSSFSGLAGTVNLTLTRPYGVYGRAYDAETKQPIPVFTVIPGRKYSTSDKRIHWERYEGTTGRNGEYSLRMSSYYFQPEGRVLIEAPGYQPQISPPFTNYDSYTNDFVLKKGKGISGMVELADGSPAIGATLVLVEKGDSASLDLNGMLRGSGSGDMARTDTRGRFEFSPKLNPDKIFVSHEQGFAEMKVAAMVTSSTIKLQSWSRITGVVRVGDKVEPEHNVRLQSEQRTVYSSDDQPSYFYVSLRGEMDTNGNFAFEKVPPGEYRVALEYRLRENNNYGEAAFSHGIPVIVNAGGSTNVIVGGTGRRVVGRVNLSGGDHSDVDWRRDVHQLMLMLPNQPHQVQFTPDGQRMFISNLDAGPRVAQTPEQMAEAQRAQRNYVLLFETNGNFRADNVPPGKYQLVLNVTDPEDEYYNRRYIGNTVQQITVPDEKNAKLNAPVNIGAIDLSIRPRIRIGKVVPSLEFPMADGKTNKLSDFRGKHVLLHFWGRSMGYNTTDFSMLRELQSTYGSSGKLVIIGCNMDQESQRKSAEQFIQNYSMTWPQCYFGYWNESPIARMFGLQGSSAAILIDPQGRVASPHLRSSSIRNTVTSALSLETE